MKHTTGPWEVKVVPIESRGGSNTCFKIGPFNACIYDDWRPRENGISHEENEANAKLIAEAPELLKALIGAVQALELFADGCNVSSEIAEGKEAIQKAIS